MTQATPELEAVYQEFLDFLGETPAAIVKNTIARIRQANGLPVDISTLRDEVSKRAKSSAFAGMMFTYKDIPLYVDRVPYSREGIVVTEGQMKKYQTMLEAAQFTALQPFDYTDAGR